MQPERLQPILDVALARFEQERALRDELKDVQDRLAERKIIERAKGLLAQQKRVSENDAFQMMRKLAMDRNRRLVDVAQQIIDIAELGS
jgi:response regulator NasT